MSDFSVPVVKVGPIKKHSNADKLSITEVDGCPVIIQTADFKEGDIAVYVPIESVVPLDRPCFSFLKDANHPERTTARIKAKKLRGVFSMGLLIPYNAIYEAIEAVNPGGSRFLSAPSHYVNLDVSAELGIVKYEEPEPGSSTTPKVKQPWWKIVLAWIKHPLKMWKYNISHPGGAEKAPDGTLVYDMESIRKYRHVIKPGELVYVSEKLHGTNFRCCFRKGKFHVGSHRTWKKESPDDRYWKIAIRYDLENKLRNNPDLIVFGEIYGSKIQDLEYGSGPGETRLAVFDLYDINRKSFLDYEYFLRVCETLNLPKVPMLYVGPYSQENIDFMADGKTTIAGATHIREGIVVKPQIERKEHGRRIIFKLIGESYMLRKNGTEGH